MLTDYTSYDEVRAVLGVSDLELEDATLALPLYETSLFEALAEATDPEEQITDMFTTVEAITEDIRSAAQRRFHNLVRSYSSYLVALTALDAARLFAPKELHDGRAGRILFEGAADPFMTLKGNVSASAAVVLGRLQTALAALDGAYSAPTATSLTAVAISRGVDPVTGV